MSINRLYSTWFAQIEQLRPEERITRQRTLAWLLVGIYQSKSVYLSKIAMKIPGKANLVSITRRLSRFLSNPKMRVREWYEPIARGLIQSMASSVGEIRLIVDGTKIGFGHQLLMIAVAFRKRSLPIAWTWVRARRGHSSAAKQLALLAYVRSLIPAGIPVSLVGDSEFGAVEVLRQLEIWEWLYVLRQKANHQVKFSIDRDWQSFGDLIQSPGQSIWLGCGFLTLKHAHPVHLLAHWKRGEEEMFGDMKGHGFDLESSHLRHFLRLSCLTLAVALLYVWLVSTGAIVIKNGKRLLVDRAERRDLSIFQIGLRSIERRLTNAFSISIRLCPTRSFKLSGS